MKKIIAILVLVAVVFIIFNRHRLYIRDPFGSLTRGGVPEPGAQIFINADKDVLLENDNAPMYLLLVQHTQIGEPTKISCAHWLACLADADIATLAPQRPLRIRARKSHPRWHPRHLPVVRASHDRCTHRRPSPRLRPPPNLAPRLRRHLRRRPPPNPHVRP